MKLFMLLFMINYNETLGGSWKGSIRQGLSVLSNDLFHQSFCLWVFSWNWNVSNFWYGARNSYEDVHDKARLFQNFILCLLLFLIFVNHGSQAVKTYLLIVK